MDIPSQLFQDAVVLVQSGGCFAHFDCLHNAALILAGILLKLGGYGLIRFSLPLFPDASVMFQPLVFGLSIIAIVYASLVAYRQTDMKKLVA